MWRRAIILVLMLGPSIVASACGDKTPVVPNTGCCPPASTVHAVTVDPAAATIRTGDRLQLEAQVTADTAVIDRSVLWSSSDTVLATVNQSGLVTPTGATGVVTITATAKADLSVTGKSRVTVIATAAPAALIHGR